jgi:hypothetical protein
MSVEAFSWALKVPVGGNAKVVLLGLANHAHPDGTEAYPALDTLAEYAHCDRSTARRNVRKLVADGWAIEDGHGPKGQMKYRLPLDRTADSKTPPGAEREGVASAPAGGGTGDAKGVAPMPPEPSLEPSTEPSRSARARADKKDEVPSDFPDELRPHAREVMRVLRTVADHHNARQVAARPLAMVLAGHRTHQLVLEAHNWASWALDKPQGGVRNCVASYRNWLDKRPSMSSVERLGAADATGALATNVHPIRRNGTPTQGDLLRAVNAHQLQAANTIEGVAHDVMG